MLLVEFCTNEDARFRRCSHSTRGAERAAFVAGRSADRPALSDSKAAERMFDLRVGSALASLAKSSPSPLGTFDGND